MTDMSCLPAPPSHGAARWTNSEHRPDPRATDLAPKARPELLNRAPFGDGRTNRPLASSTQCSDVLPEISRVAVNDLAGRCG
jgi:hypothetical protein